MTLLTPSSGEYEFFVPTALLFGDAAAVSAFTRIAKALRFLLTKGAGLWLTSYLDDYPTLECTQTAVAARTVFNEALCILGWRVALSEKKDKPFGISSFVSMSVLSFPASGVGRLVSLN